MQEHSKLAGSLIINNFKIVILKLFTFKNIEPLLKKKGQNCPLI